MEARRGGEGRRGGRGGEGGRSRISRMTGSRRKRQNTQHCIIFCIHKSAKRQESKKKIGGNQN